MSHQPNNGVTLNGTLLPDNVVPNRTDPANTASNGPAALNEQTLGDYRSERSITPVSYTHLTLPTNYSV